MKLKEAFYCPECQEVFNYAEYQTICPSCANRYAFSLQRTWFSQPKEVQNENIKINRVYVTPARYDVCRAGTTKDDYSHSYPKSQCNIVNFPSLAVMSMLVISVIPPAPSIQSVCIQLLKMSLSYVFSSIPPSLFS